MRESLRAMAGAARSPRYRVRQKQRWRLQPNAVAGWRRDAVSGTAQLHDHERALGELFGAGAGPVRRRRAGRASGWSRRRDEGPRERVRARDAAITSRSRARSSPRRRRRSRARGQQLRRAPRRRAAASAGDRASARERRCATPSVASSSSAPRRPGRSRAHARSGCWRRKPPARRKSSPSTACRANDGL